MSKNLLIRNKCKHTLVSWSWW